VLKIQDEERSINKNSQIEKSEDFITPKAHLAKLSARLGAELLNPRDIS
jgi:hypothetical protein